MKKNHKNKFFVLLFFVGIAAITTVFVMLDDAFMSSALFAKSKRYYSGPPKERQASWMIDAFATQYCQKHNMQLIHIGDFTEPLHNIAFGLWLRSFSSQTLDEGRLEALHLVNDFLLLLQNDDRAKSYYDSRKEYSRNKREPDTITLSAVGVKIAYWNKEVHRPLPPHLSEVSFYDNTFYYYVADPETQALQLLAQESYEDALQKCQ